MPLALRVRAAIAAGSFVTALACAIALFRAAVGLITFELCAVAALAAVLIVMLSTFVSVLPWADDVPADVSG